MCGLAGIVSEYPNFGLLYIVSPKAVDLADLIDSQLLSLNQKIDILLQICTAMHHCHQNGVEISQISNRTIMVRQWLFIMLIMLIDFIYICDR